MQRFFCCLFNLTQSEFPMRRGGNFRFFIFSVFFFSKSICKKKVAKKLHFDCCDAWLCTHYVILIALNHLYGFVFLFRILFFFFCCECNRFSLFRWIFVRPSTCATFQTSKQNGERCPLVLIIEFRANEIHALI